MLKIICLNNLTGFFFNYRKALFAKYFPYRKTHGLSPCEGSTLFLTIYAAVKMTRQTKVDRYDQLVDQIT